MVTQPQPYSLRNDSAETTAIRRWFADTPWRELIAARTRWPHWPLIRAEDDQPPPPPACAAAIPLRGRAS